MSISRIATVKREWIGRRATALALAVVGPLLLGIVACHGRQSLNRNDSAAAELQAHVMFLADDRLEGRGTGAPGFELATEYVVSQFAAAGVKPSGSDGSYFH